MFIAAVRKWGNASCHQLKVKMSGSEKKSEQEHIQHLLHKTCNWEVSESFTLYSFKTTAKKCTKKACKVVITGPSRRLAPVITCNAFLCFQSYIVRDISLTEIYRWLVTFIEILSAILKSTSGGVKRKIIAFWTTRFPAFTMY